MVSQDQKTVSKLIATWADSRVACLLSDLRAPGLPRCYGMDPNQESHYLFEHLAGDSLRQHQEDAITPACLERWFDQNLDSLALVCCCAGLSFSHLDLSPENLIIHESGRACIIDFASARFLDGRAAAPDGNRSLTAGYAAPEVYFGALSPETDLFSLAMTLLAAFSGKMASELDSRSIRKMMKAFKPSFATRLTACLADDPACRRPAVEGTFFGQMLETFDKPRQDESKDREIQVPSKRHLDPCPFLPGGCPFLQAADRYRELAADWPGPEGYPATCYNEPEYD